MKKETDYDKSFIKEKGEALKKAFAEDFPNSWGHIQPITERKIPIEKIHPADKHLLHMYEFMTDELKELRTYLKAKKLL